MANFIDLDKDCMEMAGQCSAHNSAKSMADLVMLQHRQVRDEAKKARVEANNKKNQEGKPGSGSARASAASSYEKLKASLQKK